MSENTKNIVIANSNPLHEQWVLSLCREIDAKYVSSAKELELVVGQDPPDYIFFPHWSYIIPNNVHDNSECVLYHMTDLPYGRGGSPLQNLILEGKENTMITAIRVNSGLDTGPIYTKQPLSLLGTAREIFIRAGKIMEGLIRWHLQAMPTPYDQSGMPTVFKRRRPEQGNLATIQTLNEVYDYIRMLDADGYPSAFIETDTLKFEFSRASYEQDQIIADVRITRK